jgi:hypothetical protein
LERIRRKHRLPLLMMAMLLCSSAATLAGEGELTADYLEGRWCYADIDFGGQTEAVAVEYVFNMDGTLEYQVSSTSERMAPGTWAIADGQLEIKPALVFFDLVIADVADDRFELDAMGGRHRFLRGACAD